MEGAGTVDPAAGTGFDDIGGLGGAEEVEVGDEG